MQILGFEERRREKAGAARSGQPAAARQTEVSWRPPRGSSSGGLQLPAFTIEQLLLLLGAAALLG